MLKFYLNKKNFIIYIEHTHIYALNNFKLSVYKMVYDINNNKKKFVSNLDFS